MRRIVLLALFVIGCSSSTTGPTPVISSIQPVPICDAQKAITLTISGSDFSPSVIDGLTSHPTVVMPQVVFIDGSGGRTEVPADGVSIPDTTGTSLVVVIPQGLVPPGTYDVEVTNPDGNSATSSGFVVDPPPDITAINPASSAPGKIVNVTLTGTGFLSTMTVTLGATPPVTCTNVVVSADGTSATCTLDLTGVTPGTYDILVDNGDGCTDTLPMAFTVGNEFILTGIDPPFGCTCSETSVTISSAAGFASTPRVEMRPHGQATPVTVLKRVAFVDSSTLTAVVPSGMALGNYDVTVIDPPSAPGTGVLDNGFRVVALPIPTIEQVVPDRAPPNTSVNLQIFGNNFRSPVTVEFLNRTGTVVATATSAPVISATQIGNTTTPVVITTPGTEDAYLVRVTDDDEMTYSTWSAFIVGATGSSGNLHTFTTSTTLTTGRRMLAGLSARDDLGNTFIYAIGGDTGGATPTVLDTVEVAQLSRFGALAAWRQEKPSNKLTTTRAAPVAVAVPIFGTDPFIPVKTYVYVTGGRDAGGAVLGTVERAVVLRNADAPRITAIAPATATGTLAAGTWYYKVSAIVSDPDNAGGETLPSDEEILTISGAQTAIDLTWSAVPNATGYRVYRTAMVDGVSQQELLIASPTGTSYTDTGATASAEPPLPPGSLGVWSVQTPTHGIRWGHQAAVITDNQGAAGGRSLYVLGGKSDATTGYLATIERAPIDAAGQLGAFTTAGTTVMSTPLAFFSLVVETAQNVSGFGGVARLFTLGGVGTAGASSEILQSDIATGGGNGAWSIPFTNAGLLTNRGGNMAVIASEKLWSVGGAQMATSTAFSNIGSVGYDTSFNSSGALIAPTSSAANLLPAARALGAPIVGSGFIYFVGGTSDGTNATNTTFQTF